MKKSKTKTSHLWSKLFLVALMAVTFYIIFKDNSPAEILNAIRGLNPVYLLVAVVMMVFSIFFQGLALGEPFVEFGKAISLRRKLDYAFAGFFFSAITPSSSGGQPMQIYYMCRDRLQLSHVSMSMLLANITYQITVLIYGIGMYFFKFSFINEKLQGFTVLLIIGILMNLAFALVILFMLCSKSFAQKFASGVVTLLCKMHIIKNEQKARNYVTSQIHEYNKCAKAIKTRPGLVIKVFVYTVLQMTTLYIIPYFVYKAFGLSGGSAFDLIALQAVLFVAVSFLPLPGAVGASESGFVKLFLVFFTGATIVPAMLISRLISFYGMLLISGVDVFLMQLRKPDQANRRHILIKRTHRFSSRMRRIAL